MLPLWSVSSCQHDYWLGKRCTVGSHETAAAAKSLQSCLTLCDPVDGSPPGSSVPGILQARILEWVAIFFSHACMLSHFSHVRLCATLWTAAHQAPLSTGFSRQEYWSGLPFPSPYPWDWELALAPMLLALHLFLVWRPSMVEDTEYIQPLPGSIIKTDVAGLP